MKYSVFLLSAAAASLLASCSDNLGIRTTDTSTNGEAVAAAAEVTQYTCPMHPHYISTDPDGSCPICGMDLVPASTLGSLAVAGVFDFPKATDGGSAIAAGAEVYWDESAGQATTDAAAGANKRIGRSIAAAADGDEVVRIRMSQ